MTDQVVVVLTKAELDAHLARAAEAGAQAALSKLGLRIDDGPKTGDDIRELRSVLEAWRDVKTTARREVVKWSVVTLLALLAAWKFWA